MKPICLITLLLLLFQGLCSNAQSDCVYIAGQWTDKDGRQYAAYWKSGALTQLTDGSDRDEARAIAVSGNQVHAGGFKMNGLRRVAAYWVNGGEVALNLEGHYSKNKDSEVYSIKMVNNDVYLFVTQPERFGNDPYYFYYYKNGKAVKLPVPDSDLDLMWKGAGRGRLSEHFFVTEAGDVYEAGTLSSDGANNQVVYWKNGRLEMARASRKYNLYEEVHGVTANSIFVTASGDVYIAGTVTYRKNVSDSHSRAVYWKNGEEITLSRDSWNVWANSIFVEANTVYVVGSECRTYSHFSAVCWTDGQKKLLHDYDSDGYDATANSVIAVNGALYVAGSHTNSVYWMNGREVKLGLGKVYAMAVAKDGGCYNNAQSASSHTQNYGQTVNQAQNSLQNGAYSDAMQGYANAAAAAGNKSERQQATAGLVISGLAGIADASQKAAEKRRRDEEAANAQKAEETARFQRELDLLWNEAIGHYNKNTPEGYRKTIELFLPYATRNQLGGQELNYLGLSYANLNDYKNCEKWITESAYKGDGHGMRNLGNLIASGRTGLRDYRKAAEWLKKACDQGVEDGCASLQRVNKDMADWMEAVAWRLPVPTDLTVPDTVTVDTVLDRYFSAIGGYAKVQTVQSITRKYTVDAEQIKGVEVLARGRFFNAFENALQNATFKSVYDGSTYYHGFDGAKNHAGVTDAMKKNHPFEMLGLNRSELKIGKIDKVMSQNCYSLVKNTVRSGNYDIVETYYFHMENGLLYAKVLVISNTPPPADKKKKKKEAEARKPPFNADPSTYYTFYQNYKPVEGILFPVEKIEYNNNKYSFRFKRTTFSEIIINDPKLESYFK